MLLFEYDSLPWLDSMTIFHTLARLGVNALSIVSPNKPFISIGYFQDAELEVDFDFCRNAGLPVLRREIGGGAVYLDYNQIFYHVILRRDHPLATLDIDKLYRVMSEPVIETYREFGIETKFKEVNDIITVEGRKISGEGAANIGNAVVFVGSLILDFDYKTMARALKVPDEKFRDKIFKTMEENVTTMRRELGGQLPPRDELRKVLIEKFEKLLGPFERASIDTKLKTRMDEVGKILISKDFLFKRTPRKPEGVRIRHGVEVLYTAHKAKGGLIRTYQEVQERRLADIAITGDFTLYPKENLDVLDRYLVGSEKVKREIESRVEEFYEKTNSQTPGVDVDDWVEAVKVLEE